MRNDQHGTLDQNSVGDSRSITYRTVVGLSHPIHPGIPLWPGDPPVKFTKAASLDSEGFRLSSFTMGEHSGTHMNAPKSFHANGRGIDEYPPESLVAPAVVLDVRKQASAEADLRLSVDHLVDWEKRWGPVPQGSFVLLSTGWSDKWGNPREYLGYDFGGQMHFPGFGLATAQMLFNERGVAGLGIDTHGLDGGCIPGQNPAFAINQLAMQQPRIALENLANLHPLPPVGCTLVIGILRLKDGAGSPASVTAFVP